MKMDTVLECPTKYVCISASGRKLIVHYEKDYSLFLSYLKPESLMFKSFTRILYFNHLKWSLAEMSLGMNGEVAQRVP